MKALRKTAPGEGHVELCEAPVPEIGPREVLMKVWAAGVCGSDLLIQEDRHFYRAPVTSGHAFSGVAYCVGAEVTRVREGEQLVADIDCGEGDWLGVTLDGAYAPFMRVPEQVIYRIPDHVTLDEACLCEPIVATHHLTQERARVKVEDDRGVFDLSPMITDHYALEDWETAFANLRAGQDVKALVHPNGREWAERSEGPADVWPAAKESE